jgi:hypothetical protein
VPCRNTRILFCKDTFDYPDLEGHELLCNHLGELNAYFLKYSTIINEAIKHIFGLEFKKLFWVLLHSFLS